MARSEARPVGRGEEGKHRAGSKQQGIVIQSFGILAVKRWGARNLFLAPAIGDEWEILLRVELMFYTKRRSLEVVNVESLGDVFRLGIMEQNTKNGPNME